MSCGKGYESGSCVGDILREITDAQRDIVENCCDSSCERSIGDLLGDTDSGNGLDTVPLILYCMKGCNPFKGYGAHPDHIGDVKSSFYFRVKSISDEDNCAVLELLKDPKCESRSPDDPMDQRTHYLRATGICMTVDIDCFCHVTCLPAISAF